MTDKMDEHRKLKIKVQVNNYQLLSVETFLKKGWGFEEGGGVLNSRKAQLPVCNGETASC